MFPRRRRLGALDQKHHVNAQKVKADSQMPRPKKLNRNGAHLDMYGGIWNSSSSVAKGSPSALCIDPNEDNHTGPKEDDVASNYNALAIAKVSVYF